MGIYSPFFMGNNDNSWGCFTSPIEITLLARMIKAVLPTASILCLERLSWNIFISGLLFIFSAFIIKDTVLGGMGAWCQGIDCTPILKNQFRTGDSLVKYISVIVVGFF